MRLSFIFTALMVLVLSACSTYEGDKTSLPQITKESCNDLTNGKIEILNAPDKNIERRTVLAHCVSEGLLNFQKTYGNIADSTLENSIQTNDGLALEQNNIWFYMDGDAGQVVGLNLNNATKKSISSIRAGFHKGACSKNTAYDYLIEFGLDSPLDVGEKTVALWTMPQRVKIANGCLDILAVNTPYTAYDEEADMQCFHGYSQATSSEDIKQAFPICLKAAKSGAQGSQYVIGIMYLANDQKDKAIYWLKKAADNGYDPAIEKLEALKETLDFSKGEGEE